METIERIASLQMERAQTIEYLGMANSSLRGVKVKLANAQSIQHQNRLDAEHRKNLRVCVNLEATLTFLNARIKSLNEQLQHELRDKKRGREAVV